jgi:hypothetical protein
MPVAEFRTKTLEIIDSAEDFVLGAVDDAFEAVQGYIPELDLPVVDKLPKASAIVDEVFGFAADVLASQREFVGQLVTKAEALVPSGGDSPVSSVA